MRLSCDKGVISGIARKPAPRAAMVVLDRSAVTIEGGIVGDCRGKLKPGGRNRRQVTLFEREDWVAAMSDLYNDAHWSLRRCNLMVDGLDLPQRSGTRLKIGDVLLEVTVECDPCARMDAVVPGCSRRWSRIGAAGRVRGCWRGVGSPSVM